MAENSKIEWTDHTFNPWIGCNKVSPGCANCYAERDFDKRLGFAKWGPHGPRVVTGEANWRNPVKWDKAATCNCFARADLGEKHIPATPHTVGCPQANRPRVFCASLADVFEDWQGSMADHRGQWLNRCCNCGDVRAFDPVARLPEEVFSLDCTSPSYLNLSMGDVRARLFELIDATPNLDWLLLTKRPENIRRMWCSHVNTDGRPPSSLYRPNVWLLTSIENQETADERIPHLLKCRDLCPVLGLSCEPLLGPVDLTGIGVGTHYQWLDCLNGIKENSNGSERSKYPHVDWVIVGGESGPNARPMHPLWARLIRDQCADACVPFFYKQWGEFAPRCTPARAEDSQVPPVSYRPGCADPYPLGWVKRVGKKAAGRLLDGREWNEFPQPVRADAAGEG